jgi:formate/nitrite transporter FocA (FNT family)
MSDVRIDALLPPEMATRAEHLGVRKAETPFLKMFMLAILAGAFIALVVCWINNATN